VADSLNADLSPVNWTMGASTREPRQEGRERGRDHKNQKSATPQDEVPAVDTQDREVSEVANPETPAPHKLDSFA
jgi:hypothetical protein